MYQSPDPRLPRWMKSPRGSACRALTPFQPWMPVDTAPSALAVRALRPRGALGPLASPADAVGLGAGCVLLLACRHLVARRLCIARALGGHTLRERACR